MHTPQRIAIVGSGGSGKSTFAERLGARTGLPVTHLDEVYWKPGWVEPDKDEWIEVQRQLAAADRWIIDGNHGSTIDVRFSRADTVVFLDIPRSVCLRGILYRHFFSKKLQAEGCPNRLDRDFLKWVWQFPNESRPRLIDGFARHPHLRVVVIHSRDQMDAALDALDPGDPAGVDAEHTLQSSEGDPTSDAQS